MQQVVEKACQVVGNQRPLRVHRTLESSDDRASVP